MVPHSVALSTLVGVFHYCEPCWALFVATTGVSANEMEKNVKLRCHYCGIVVQYARPDELLNQREVFCNSCLWRFRWIWPVYFG